MLEIEIIILSNSKTNLLQIYDNNYKIKDIIVNNKYLFLARLNHAYKIKIINQDNIFQSSFYVNNYYKPYVFDIRNKYHHIFIQLKDKYYPNLKIKKGEIIFGKTI